MLVEQGGSDVIKRLFADKSTQTRVLKLCESIAKSLHGEGLVSQGWMGGSKYFLEGPMVPVDNTTDMSKY